MAEHVRKNLDIPKFIKLLEAGWTDKQLANYGLTKKDGIWSADTPQGEELLAKSGMSNISISDNSTKLS